MKARTSICDAQPARRIPWRLTAHPCRFETRLCVPDDQIVHLPKGQVLSMHWPAGVPLPKSDEVIYLTSASAWRVRIVIHEFVPGGSIRSEIWIEWIGSARQCRIPEVSDFVH
jgi:hypothetical protein